MCFWHTILLEIDGDAMAPTPTESLYKVALTRFKQYGEDRYRDDKERELLDDFLRQRATPEDTKLAAESLKHDAGKKWSNKKVGDVEIPDTWIANILGNIGTFVAAGNSVMEGAPESVGLAWFAVKLTLTAIQNNYELYTFFGSGLTDISEIMIIVRHYDRLYDERHKPHWKASALVEKLFQDVITAYSAVLDFSFAIKRHLTAGTLTRIKHGFKDFFGGSKAKFEGKLSTIATLKKKILEESQGAFQDKTLSKLEGVSNVLGDISSTIQGIQKAQERQEEWHNESMVRLDTILNGLEEIRASTKRKTPWDFALQDFQKHQAALKPLPPTEVALGLAIDARHPGTCEWVFDEYSYTTWESSENHSMLSITGQGGTGKSTVIASIVERLLSVQDSNKSLFYLSCGAAGNGNTGAKTQSLTADRICHTFLSRIYGLAAEDQQNLPLLESCNDVFANPKAHSPRGTNLVGNLKTNKDEDLPDFADAFARIVALLKKNVVIVLDGVDSINISDKDQEDLFAKFKDLLDTGDVTASSGIRIQVLVGCRSSTRFSAELPYGSFIDVTSFSDQDINITLTAALEGVRGLSTAEREEAKKFILARTGFRFDYLCAVAMPFIREPFQRPLSRRLEALPEGINDTYTTELRKMNPNYVDLLRTTLTWVLLGQRDCLASEVIDAFNGVYSVLPATDIDADAEQGSGFPVPSRLEIDQLRRASGPFFEVQQDSISGQDYWVFVKDAHVSAFCLDSARESHEEQHASDSVCARCKESIAEPQTLSISRKEGHLNLALECLRHLNHPLFQKRAGLLAEIRLLEEPDNVTAQTIEESTVPVEEITQTAQKGVSIADEVGVISPQSSEESVETKTGRVEAANNIDQASTEKDNEKEQAEDLGYISDSSIDDEDREGGTGETAAIADGDTGVDDTLAFLATRLEIQSWPFHIKRAEELWTVDERAENETWAALMEELDKLAFEKPLVFWNWQKKYHDPPYDTFNLSGNPHKPLHVAAYLGISSWAKHLIERGEDPNELSGRCNALQAAATRAEKLDVLKVLLENGGDLNAENEVARPAFHSWLYEDCTLESAQLMIKHGADPKIMNKLSNWTALHHFAWKGDDPTVLELLLEHGADINAKDDFDTSPLHTLLRRREVPLALLKAFVERGADINAEDKHSVRPLQSASLFGELEALKIIAAAGLSEIDDLDNDGDTALHQAAIGGHAECVRFLWGAGASPNIPNKRGQTALHDAALRGSEDCVGAILDFEKETGHSLDINAFDKRNKTPLFCACLSHEQGTANLILDALLKRKEPLAEINKPSLGGRTPLRQAASHGFDGIVSKLIRTSVDQNDAASLAVNAQDRKSGMTALHRAAWRGHTKCVRLLLSSDAKADPSVRDTKSRTALVLAYEQWALSSDQASFEDIISLLIAASPSAAAQDPELAAICAVNGSTKLLRQLWRLNADLNRRDRYGWTPLELARKFSQTKAAEFLKRQVAWVGMLPSRWATDFPATMTVGARSVAADGTTVTHLSEERVCISTDRPLPAGLEQYYFEVTFGDVSDILTGGGEQKENPIAAVGFCTIGGGVIQFPGWPSRPIAPGAKSWGYHGDDGGLFVSSNLEGSSKAEAKPYGPGDTIGCGVDLAEHEIWFTLNGVRLDATFAGVDGRLFPLLGLKEVVTLQTNFGAEPFKWKGPDEQEGDGPDESQLGSENTIVELTTQCN
ncbi:ankyrin repeat-containing domain protein [Lasiosphaeris hirsuta]|uniref:Ankyrin repeat-containing domain protein n=1 Tax=Lasiosphaeris hirsuta TaxID=260670 RepID=A0AA40A1W5_9PEZI|nr:ankyrin repeat-containing domain protein [Lasiosphaeris hirsuta]